MTYISHGVAEKICVFRNNVEAENHGKCHYKNVFDGRLTSLIR
jgi:hypothetical protein